MECRNCGTENGTRTFYCGGCGRPVGTGPDTTTIAADEPGLEDLPAPAASRETAAATGERALCSLCLGAFPAKDLSYIDGRAYCHDCSPVRGSRSEHSAPVEAFEQPPQHRTFTPMAPGGDFGGGQPRFGQPLMLGGLLIVLAAGAVLAYVSLGGGGGRIGKILSGLDTDRTDAVMLLQEYRAGDTFDYVMGMDIALEFSGKEGGFLGDSMEGNAGIGIEADFRLAVESVSTSGNADVLVEISGVKMDVSGELNGQQLPTPPMPSQGTCSVRMTLDPAGQPIEGSVRGDGSLPDGMDMTAFTCSGIQGPPDRPMKVGEKWVAEFNPAQLGGANAGSLDFGGNVLIATYEVMGFKREKGFDCVAIRMTGGVNAPNVKADLAGAALLDVETRQVVLLALDIDIDVSMDFGQASARASGGVKMDLELR